MKSKCAAFGVVPLVANSLFGRMNRPRIYPLIALETGPLVCRTCPASNDDDDAVMRLPLCQLDEVVAVTRHQEATVFVSELQDCRIGDLLRENIAQAQHFVTEFLE